MERRDWSVKFVDDTEIARLANTLYDLKGDKLVAWANRWEMDFNVNKWRVMHIGKRNLKFQYQINDGWVK